MIAYCIGKHYIVDRFNAICVGLKAAGYVVDIKGPRGKPAPGDVLCIWNRKESHELIADRFEAAGGTVLVFENGYCGKDRNGQQHYAIAIHGHNGSGTWYSNGVDRWRALGIELKPWRSDGRHIVVCPNRQIGPKWFRPPLDWTEKTVARLRQFTRREIKVKPHPGHWKRLPVHPVVELTQKYLTDAWAMVIWSSSAGVHALINGIPVIRCAPWWIAAEAAGDDLVQIENPPMPERLPAFQRLAWAQWSISEIASGIPFKVLRGEQGAVC